MDMVLASASSTSIRAPSWHATQGPVGLQISSDYRPVREGRASLRPTEAEGKLRGDVEEVMGRVAHLIEQLVGAGVGV